VDSKKQEIIETLIAKGKKKIEAITHKNTIESAEINRISIGDIEYYMNENSIPLIENKQKVVMLKYIVTHLIECRFTQLEFAQAEKKAELIMRYYPEITKSKAIGIISGCLSTQTERKQYNTVKQNINICLYQ